MRPALKTSFAFLTVALASCAAAPAAHAQSQRAYFTATIETIFGTRFDPSVSIGGIVNGYFQFPTAVRDRSTDPNEGFYDIGVGGAPNGFFVSFGNYTFSSLPTSSSSVAVYNNRNNGNETSDTISLDTLLGQLSSPQTGPSRDGFEYARITLIDPSATALSSDALVIAPDINAFQERTFRFRRLNHVTLLDAQVTARLTSLSLQPTSVVPEPGTAALAASGLLTLVGAVVRRRQVIGTRSA